MKKQDKPSENNDHLSELELLKQTGEGLYTEPASSYEELKRRFNLWAVNRYGSYNEYANRRQYHPELAFFKHVLPLINGNNPEFLDIGCGTGLSGIPFVEKGISIDGIDFSEEMLKIAFRSGYRRLFQLNIVTDSFEDFKSKYDGAICVGVLGDYIPPCFLEKMLGVLCEKSLFAFAGRFEFLDGKVEDTLKKNRFQISLHSKDFAYFNDFGRIVDYLYVVANRG